MSDQTTCPTTTTLRENLALPPDISSVLDPPLKSLGYELKPAKDLDMSNNEFTFYRALNGGEKSLTFAYVQSLENRECAETIIPLGFLLRKQRGPLIVFSGGQHVDSVYTDDVTELWESMGFDYVRLYTARETGLIAQQWNLGNVGEVQRKLRKYLGLGEASAGKEEKMEAEEKKEAEAEKVEEKAKPDKVKIFISYSHDDKQYFEDRSLIHILRPLERQGAEFWSDQDIQPGDLWHKMIKERIGQSHIALMLVSQYFLDSEYCLNVEIPSFIQKAEKEGLLIFPIMLSTCLYNEHDWLAARQFIPSEGVIDVDFLDPGKRMKLFVEIRSKLLAAIQKIRASGGTGA